MAAQKRGFCPQLITWRHSQRPSDPMLRTTHSTSDRVFILCFIIFFVNTGWQLSAQVTCRRYQFKSQEQHLLSRRLHVLPKPRCRTCPFVIFRFLYSPLLPALPHECQEWASFSDHYSSKKFKRGMPFNFFPPPQMQSVIRNPSCHGDAIFGAECLLPHFF